MYFQFVGSLLCINAVLQVSEPAKILGIVSTPSYSHQVAYQPLWKELSLRGHRLTILTTHPINDLTLTNLTEIDLSFSIEIWNKNVLEMFKFTESMLTSINKVTSTVTAIIEQQLQHPPVQALINNKSQHFDLVIVEFSPTMVAFSKRFNCPSIGMMSMDPPAFLYNIMGNPSHPIANLDSNVPFEGELNFMERLTVTGFNLVLNSYFEDALFSPQRKIVGAHFGEAYPDLKSIASNMSLLFLHTNIFDGIRPLLPNIVQIGGGTVRQPSQPLSADLQKLLDGALQGFIYFSLGSNVKFGHLSKSSQKIILEVFTELPYLVLWKCELDDLPYQPKNVFVSQWFSQQGVLSHPNIRLFITQGGQQSLEETLHSHVPIVGMPIYGDQLGNVRKTVSKGLGLSVDHATLTKQKFRHTILEVAQNPKYRNKVKESADLISDQPMTGLERAVWWTEYVLRHKGARHLRSPVLDIPSYQYYLLDIIGFSLFLTLVLIYLLIRLFKAICKLVKYCGYGKLKEKIL